MLTKFNVLVVDDEPDKRQLLQIALEMAGYNVRTASDGVAALAIIEAQPFDLVVTDIMMPRMDGYEMVKRIRANPQTRFIPVIIQTAAKGDAQDMRRGSQVGAMSYITDPTDLDLLLARARILLDFKNYFDSCEEAAFIDEMTGLNNRRFFTRRLQQVISQAQQQGKSFCLLLLDIDHFKKVNDSYGHDVGDEVIIRVAQELKAIKQGKDIAARVGGEEFSIILPDTNIKQGVEVAERLRAAIKGMDIPDVGKITISCGVAEFPSCALDSRTLYKAADTALYEAKRQGRDRVEYSKDATSLQAKEN